MIRVNDDFCLCGAFNKGGDGDGLGASLRDRAALPREQPSAACAKLAPLRVAVGRSSGSRPFGWASLARAVRCTPASGRFAPCVRRATRRSIQVGSLPNRSSSSRESGQFQFDKIEQSQVDSHNVAFPHRKGGGATP